jgi:hypothetical protein
MHFTFYDVLYCRLLFVNFMYRGVVCVFFHDGFDSYLYFLFLFFSSFSLSAVHHLPSFSNYLSFFFSSYFLFPFSSFSLSAVCRSLLSQALSAQPRCVAGHEEVPECDGPTRRAHAGRCVSIGCFLLCFGSLLAMRKFPSAMVRRDEHTLAVVSVLDVFCCVSRV